MWIFRKLGTKNGAWGLVVPALLLTVWEIVSRFELYSDLLLVPPRTVLRSFLDLVESGELYQHMRISMFRILAGFSAGSLLGFLLGAAMGLSKRMEEFLGPIFHTARQVPLYAWLPMLILWFGVGEVSKAIFIAVAPFCVMGLYTSEGIKGVPSSYLEVGKVLEYPKSEVLLKLILPAALPSIATGLRISLSFSWMALVGAELLAASTGIGHLMSWGRQIFQIDRCSPGDC